MKYCVIRHCTVFTAAVSTNTLECRYNITNLRCHTFLFKKIFLVFSTYFVGKKKILFIPHLTSIFHLRFQKLFETLFSTKLFVLPGPRHKTKKLQVNMFAFPICRPLAKRLTMVTILGSTPAPLLHTCAICGGQRPALVTVHTYVVYTLLQGSHEGGGQYGRLRGTTSRARAPRSESRAITCPFPLRVSITRFLDIREWEKNHLYDTSAIIIFESSAQAGVLSCFLTIIHESLRLQLSKKKKKKFKPRYYNNNIITSPVIVKSFYRLRR